MELPERTLKILHIPEPLMEFGNRQTSDHPKDGLFLYGAHDGPRSIRHVSVGVVGTEEGIGFLMEWADKLSRLVRVPPPGRTEKRIRLHLSDFPGLTETFGISIDPDEFVRRPISAKAIDDATRTLNHHEAVAKAVALYIDEIVHHDRHEEHKVDVWLLVLPELVFERCKPQSRRSGLGLVKGDFGKRQKTRCDLPLLEEVIDQTDEEIFDDIPDFHRQVKARLLQIGYTSQLLRETTLAPDSFKNSAGYPKRALQEPASVAWNIATGLYYKTQPTGQSGECGGDKGVAS